jgi:hypothetical protein
VAVAFVSHGIARAQPTVPAPAPAPSPAVSPTPPADVANAPAPEDDAVVPDLDDALADVDAGGIGESLSTVPNFIGDGCAPQASTARVPVGRLAAAAGAMYLISDTQTPFLAQDGGNGSSLYIFPQGLNSVAALQAAGQTGIPGTPVGPQIDPPDQVLFAVSGTSPGPGTLVDPGPNYQTAANTQFQQMYPGAQNGTTVFNAPASGYLASGTTSATYTAYAFYDYVVDTTVLMPGANVGFVKLSENVSPLPRDRVYFSYSYFHNAQIGDIRNDVNRYTPGFEKTFFDGWTSIEVRTPFAATVANIQSLDPNDPCGMSNAQAVEFGNMSVIFKSVIALGRTWAWTGGMQVALPTAGDTILNAAPGGPTVVRVNNESVRLMPFSGFIWAPNETYFSQALLQVDTAANGNPALLATPGQSNLNYVGKLQYPTFMYLSFAAGYWAYRSRETSLTGFAPIMELHVNQGLQPSQVIQQQDYRLGADVGTVSLINGLVGCNFEWGERSTLTFGYVTPLGGGADRWFDGELRAFYNWRFGPQNRLTRVQF